MCIVFTCGEQECTKPVPDYEGLTVRCNHCGNWSASVIKRQPWFTFCFVPVVPLSIHGYDDIVCSICRFAEPLQNRPDVVSMAHGNGGVPMQPQGPPQGYGGPAGIPPKPQQQMQYR